MAYLAILPTAAAVSDILLPELARIIAEYARAPDAEVVQHLCWRTTEPMVHTLIHDPPIISPYALVSIYGETIGDPGPKHSSIIKCTVTGEYGYLVSVFLDGNILNRWGELTYDFHHTICTRVIEYGEPWFTPFVEIMHARLQRAILHGDA